eukprot:6679512-Prymnesium_polylepis.1
MKSNHSLGLCSLRHVSRFTRCDPRVRLDNVFTCDYSPRRLHFAAPTGPQRRKISVRVAAGPVRRACATALVPL